MPNPPDHAVLIVNYNSWGHLRRCLRALDLQTLRSFNVYVLDNASDEPPPEDIVAWPGLHLTRQDRNLGFAAGCNLLAKTAGASWSIFLNPDTQPEPDWFERLCRASHHHPDHSVFSSRLIQPDASSLDGEGDCYHISGLFWRCGHGMRIRPAGPPREVFSASGAAAMIRTSVFLQVGGFDEDFFCYVEDVDLGFRLRLRGEVCLLVPDATVVHEGAVTSGGHRSSFATYHGHRNLVWCYFKNMPMLLLILTMPLHLVLNLITLVVLASRGQLKTGFEAKRDALRGLPRMWRKRRAIHESRRVRILDLLGAMQILPRWRRFRR
ncbi:MAG: glycosyltransferase family 2 protein [Proteobacteria bacterium]|nr:glycosyltransferase family 2 protein [Pseudomonadota bacterium]MDA1301033.1 glycosyltransferase family 2 protein [Pseudomonadota bacterium]